MTTIAERRRQTAAPGQKVEMQIFVSAAAVLGLTVQGISARPSASGGPPMVGTSTLASGSPARFAPTDGLKFLGCPSDSATILRVR